MKPKSAMYINHNSCSTTKVTLDSISINITGIQSNGTFSLLHTYKFPSRLEATIGVRTGACTGNSCMPSSQEYHVYASSQPTLFFVFWANG